MSHDYTREPINKQASIVTSQPKELTDIEKLNHERESLKVSCDALMVTISKTKSEKAKQQLQQNHARLREINTLLKRIRNQDIGNYILEVAKERLPAGQWKSIVTEAKDRFQKGKLK